MSYTTLIIEGTKQQDKSKLQLAFELGKKIGLQGLSRALCPFDRTKRLLRIAWLRGWQKAFRMLLRNRKQQSTALPKPVSHT
jgi:ribosome modulation factor